jgi:2-amino-4-hydroxy-6-hydroxymethyldihydropteridine diphosphokinase/dihydropteroate synthase
LCPIELLDELQGIENRMGRVKVIVLYDNETFLNDRLQIPHKLMLEREFVLRPLCEYASLAVLSSSTN